MMCINSFQVLFLFGILFIYENISDFQCRNGNIIPDQQFCNRFNDCKDNSDEEYGCGTRCGKGKFECFSNKNCIDIKKRCNAVNDCSNGYDEKHCSNQSAIINLGDCNLDRGKFLCKNKLECIDFSKTCDGKYDCKDHSDENYTNCSKLDSTLCSPCLQYCLPTPDGPHCFCNSSNSEVSPVCKDIGSCNGCSQHCTRYGNFTRCLCYEGFHEVPGTDGKQCRNNYWLDTVLLYSTASEVKLLNFTSNAILLLQDNVNCTALTASLDSVYYAEFHNDSASIRKSIITGRETPEKIVELDSRITSISVDWITENVYFTSNKSLNVCSRNGRICTQLKCCEINYVVLAPKYGRMFYSQYVKAKEEEQFIIKSNMDGSDEDNLLPNNSFQALISMVFDEDKDRLYWMSGAKKELYSIALDGINKHVKRYLESVSILYLSVQDETAFFAKQNENLIYYSEKILTTENIQLIPLYKDNSTSYVKHLYIHKPALQRTYQVTNVCGKAPCNGLCLTRSSSKGVNYTCLCENFTLIEDNHWCDNYKKYSSQKPTSVPHNSFTNKKTTPSKESSTTREQLPSSAPPELNVRPTTVSSTKLSHQINFTKEESVHPNESSTLLTKTYDYVVIYSSRIEVPTSTEPMTNFTLKQVQGLEENSSSGTKVATSMGSPRSDHLVRSNVAWFILVVIGAFVGMGVYLIYQKFIHEKHRRGFRLISTSTCEEIEM